MKKYIVIIALFIGCTITYSAYSQNVGINTTGTTPNSSAILDMNSGNTYTGAGKGKGLLIPNVALSSSTDNATISNPSTSLLVYVPSGSGLTPAGYYYNSGTSASPVWEQLTTSASSSVTASSSTGSTVKTDNTVASTSTSLTGTFTVHSASFTSTGASITLPATAGTYLVIASAEVACVSGSASNSTSIYLADGTNYYGNTTPAQSQDGQTSYWIPWTTTLTTSTTSSTFKVYVANANNSSGSKACARNITISYVKIL